MVNQILTIRVNNIYISKGGLDESSPYNKLNPTLENKQVEINQAPTMNQILTVN